MHATVRSRWRILPIIMVILCPLFTLGQGRFTVNGRMKIEGGDLSSTRVVVMKDGVKERTISSGLNKFTLDLETGHTYILSFEKDGYVSKKLSFNTNAPAEAAANGFTPFDFAVSLFKQYDDINLVVFNQPVGIIRYDEKTGDFDYDTDYTKSIQSQLQQVLAEVEQKQKEEGDAAKAQEAKAVEEAKAKAKAEAEAQKQAAAKAKAEAEAQKQATAKAKAEAEAQKQAEAKAQAEAEAMRRAEAAKNTPAAPVASERPQAPEKAIEAPAPKPAKRAAAPPAQHAASISKGVEGSDVRRTASPMVQEEASRVQRARMNTSEEVRPVEAVEVPEVLVDQRTIVETKQVVSIITVTRGSTVTENRKVTYKSGGQYYYKNGATCSQEMFQLGTQVDDLAGVSPRSKLD